MEDLVKRSVGFDAERGDQIVVTSIPFRKVELETGFVEKGFWKSKLDLIAPFIKYFVSLIALILTLFFILRPLIKFIMTMDRNKEIGAGELPPVSVAQLPGKNISLDLGGETDESLKGLDVVRDLAGRDARNFAELLRNWLK